MDSSTLVSCPHISVVVPTRNRPADVRRCLDSLTEVRYPNWDVLLVDQGDDETVGAVADNYSSLLPALTYMHMNDKGLSRARNAAIQATSGDIVAFLDDDCTVEPDWLQQVAAAFGRHAEAGLVFGVVKSVPHDSSECFIPVYEVSRERVLRGRRAILQGLGIGASMYVRRALTRHVEQFDIGLGAGALFSASDDTDYSYRMLTAGGRIVTTPSIAVWHYGARDYRSGSVSRLFRVTAYSIGAADMKLLRCREMAALLLIVVHAWQHLMRINPRNVLARRGPTGLAWITMYVRGLFASFQLDVDRHGCLYVAAPDRRAG